MKYSFTIILIFNIVFCFAQNYHWNTLATGAGGWITGMDIHSSGAPLYARSDVGSAYKFNAVSKEWENIVTAENLPANDVYWNRYGGVLSIVSAPSNANKAYMAYVDGIFSSNNQGLIWTKTNFPTIDLPSNDDDSKLSGERLAVDPVNENLVYFGSPNDGLWRTEDGGNTWSEVNSIPAGLPFRGVRQIIFDSNNGTTNGKTNNIYVTVDGEGVFQSTNAGATWSDLSFNFSVPIFLDADVDLLGNFFCVGRDVNFQTFGIQKYDGSNWMSIQNNGTVYFNVAIDPFDNNRIVALSEGFTETALTTNANAAVPNWSYPSKTKSATNIPWMAWIEGDWFTIGEMFFDPNIPNKLWISDGIGVWNINSINTNTMVWEENSKGQEHLVSNDITINQEGKAVTAHWDRPIFWHNTLTDYPGIHQPSDRFNSAWDMDASPANRNFIVGIIEDHRYCCYDEEHRNSGFSNDGGQTWTKFAAQPDPTNSQGIYGNIAVSATDNNHIVWLPTGNQNPYFSTDMGASWSQATLPNNQGNCCLNFNFVYKKALTADKILPNTFYIYNWENGSIYVSNDGGANWIERTALQDYYGWNAKLSATPNQANHLWYSHGSEQEINFMQPLKRSIDGGVSWQILNNTSEVLNHAIGAPLTGFTYPTIFLQGRVNGVFGYWMTADEGNTWTNIGTYPNGIYDIAKVMEGDPNIPSRVYLGFGGNGFAYGQDDDMVLSTTSFEKATPHFRIFPNPVNDVLFINSDIRIQSISVYNTIGQLVLNLENETNITQINLKGCTSGMYFLKVNNQYYFQIKKE